MAYYEMMPAGLPAGLQSGMDSVLNKKFGTATSYAPGTWPDTVNLMGPLPEKTIVSSPIADFSDGADDVPTKSLVVTIPPTLSGVSSVTETQTGKSLANIADVSGSMTNAYFYNIGSDFVLTARTTYKIVMEVNSTVTPFAVSVGVGDNAYRYDIYNTGINNKNGVVAFEFTVEASHLATWNKLWIRAPRYSAPSEPSTPTTCTFTVKNITLYTSAIVYTASLGRTIYGGKVDIVNGTGTDENGNDFTFTGQEIPTMLGYNAFWSDQGDTEVTYRADINLALQALSGLRGLMMARPQLEPETEPEETIEETPEEMER